MNSISPLSSTSALEGLNRASRKIEESAGELGIVPSGRDLAGHLDLVNARINFAANIVVLNATRSMYGTLLQVARH
jgi:hypothetical protein